MDIKKIIMWSGLYAIVFLIVLSIASAFLGADKATVLFNSFPLIVFWFLLLILLLISIFTSKSKNPPILLMHIGAICILLGGMWGSSIGHNISNKLFNQAKIREGYIALYKNVPEVNEMTFDAYNHLAKLPFTIILRDFHIENYSQTDFSPIKNFSSDISILKDNKNLINARIKVNHPLHFAGYHFYQNSYDPQSMTYTVLQIVSDNGLYTVYTGLLLLCIGIFWRFWIKPWRQSNGD